MFQSCSENDDINETENTENVENTLVAIRLLKEKSGDFENKYVFDSNNVLVKIQSYYYGTGFIPGINPTTNLAGETILEYDNVDVTSSKSYYNNGEIYEECFFNYDNTNLISIIKNVAFGNGINQTKTELKYDTNDILNKVLIYNDQNLTIEYDVVINENGNLSEISNNSNTTPIYYDNKPSPYKNYSLASKFLTMAGTKSIFSNNNEVSSDIEIIYNSDDYPSQKKWSYPQPNSTVFITTIDYEYELFDN
jgi:hypothetical protein